MSRLAARTSPPGNPQPLDPAIIRIIEALARAQARREYRRERERLAATATEDSQ